MNKTLMTLLAAALMLSCIARADAAQVTRIRIKAVGREMAAELDDNAATRALVKRLPLKLRMLNLYSREMCFNFGEALPTDNLRGDGYQAGDLIYWPPGRSLVILYKQDGEKFDRQQLGHIKSGFEIFNGAGETEVTFEKAE